MIGGAFAVWNDMTDYLENGMSEYDIYDRIVKGLPLFAAKLWGKQSLDLAGAESQVKSKYPKSTIEKLQLDVENNTLVYDVSLTEGKKEIDLELDANTGQIVEEDIETEKD